MFDNLIGLQGQRRCAQGRAAPWARRFSKFLRRLEHISKHTERISEILVLNQTLPTLTIVDGWSTRT